MQGEDCRFASVIVPAPLKEPLVYAVPPSCRDLLMTGMRVWVPLGRRKVTGVVAGFLSQTSLKETREILAPLDERPVLDPSLIELSRWISRYYLSPIGEVLAGILPPTLREESRRTIHLLAGEFAVTGETERKILGELRAKKGETNLRSLARRFPGRGFYRALNNLVALGAVELRERGVVKREKKSAKMSGVEEEAWAPTPRLSLTPEQERALQALQDRLQKGGFETFLLHGVTGSGKTEVYLRAMEQTRTAQRRSLILVPEISLTPRLLDLLRERFPNRVGVLHSGLTPSDRWAQWWHILRGDVDVVVGARSAIFAPVPELGLIIVDEEHDPSYKQEEGLRYHARDLAVVRGKLVGCPVLLGSATPAVESFENCRRGRYRLLELTQRVEQRALPQVEAVDLRQERRGEAGARPDFKIFSANLIEALLDNYKRGNQSLIFLNRRGFANFLQCHFCGFALRCPHCSVTLTYHLKHGSLFCHHCGFRKAVHDLCPGCGNLTLAGMGFGTERVERELAQAMPEARIARMDRDTTRKRGAQERLIRRWQRGEIDILVGTQMVTKGHDVSGVTLVGVVLADLSLNVPDFRAAERTFQLLTQVAGRAGRGKGPGRVIIQTYAPEHHALRYAMTHDYNGFFSSELEFRQALSYPPFSRMILLRLEGPNPAAVESGAKSIGEALRKRLPENSRTEILGPAPAPLERLRRRYRWQILLKGQRGSSLSDLARQARDLIPPSRRLRLYIDVDPYNML